MLFKFKLLIIYFLLSSCLNRANIDIEDEFKGDYYEFLDELNKRNIPYEESHLIVRTTSIEPDGVAGLCAIKTIPVGRNLCIISISPEYTRYKQKIIFFHELTHCIFDLRNHYEELDTAKGANSIFNTYYDYSMPDDSYFYQLAIKKLFDHDIPFMLKNK